VSSNRTGFIEVIKGGLMMAKTLEQIKASGLAMDIQEFTSERPECNNLTVEDFVIYLLDYAQAKED
jgi:hypothetical protein